MMAHLLLLACTPAIKAPVHGGEPVLARAHFVTADGTVLPLRAWWPVSDPVKGIVVALHGFNDYGRAFTQPGKYLSRRGIALVAYDQRGFGHAPGRGLWAGTESYIADLDAVVSQLRRSHPGVPVFVLGESMGGAVAIAALTSPAPPKVDGLILSAPAVWSREMMPWYQRAVLALASATVPELELTGSGLKIQASDNIEMLRGLGRDPLVIKATRVDAIDGLADLMDVAQHRVGQLSVPVLVLYGGEGSGHSQTAGGVHAEKAGGPTGCSDGALSGRLSPAVEGSACGSAHGGYRELDRRIRWTFTVRL